jgi:hypothetical protein
MNSRVRRNSPRHGSPASPRARELLAYGLHTHELGAYLGAVELQDPLELIATGLL